MILDASTQRNLELTESLFDRRTEGSLFAVLDRTVTGMGRRRLKFWVLHPLLPAQKSDDARMPLPNCCSLPLRQGLRTQLRWILDLERLTSRLTSQIARPRDLVALKASLAALPAMVHLLDDDGSHSCVR